MKAKHTTSLELLALITEELRICNDRLAAGHLGGKVTERKPEEVLQDYGHTVGRRLLRRSCRGLP